MPPRPAPLQVCQLTQRLSRPLEGSQAALLQQARLQELGAHRLAADMVDRPTHLQVAQLTHCRRKLCEVALAEVQAPCAGSQSNPHPHHRIRQRGCDAGSLGTAAVR